MNDSMALLAEVRRRILLGVGARAPIPEAEGELGALLEKAANVGETETAWLHALAVIGGWHRGGVRAAVMPGFEAPKLEAEVRARVSTDVAAWIDLALASADASNLVREGLERIDARGLRVPPRQLPALLDHGRRHVAMRPLVARVCGELGAWLAARHEPWSALFGPPAHDRAEEDERFETAPLAVRRSVLESWRERGEDAHARERLDSVWKQERAKERATLLASFAVELGPEDEAFLEARLGDRSQEVRSLAADLLARLPDSAFAGRMRERVQRHVKIEEAPPTTRLEIELPAELPDDWKRDGLLEKGPSGVGQRTWWLQQIVEHASLARCRAAWKVDASTFLEAIDASDHARGLRAALERSAERTRDVELADALLEAGSRQLDVFLAGSPEVCERALAKALRGEAWEEAFGWLADLARRRTFSASFQREALEQYAGRLHASTMTGRMPYVNVDDFFFTLSPEHLERARELLLPLLAARGAVVRRAQELLERLALRQRLHECLS